MFLAGAPPPIGSKAVTYTAVLSISGNALDLQSGQIAFPATQSASAGANTLDDYEEGTWTPVLTASTVGNLTVVYSTQVGHYTKIGRLVMLAFTAITSTWTWTSASGNLQMTGAPFAAGGANSFEVPLGSFQGLTLANFTQFATSILNGATLLNFFGSASAQNRTQLAISTAPTATQKTIIGQQLYHV